MRNFYKCPHCGKVYASEILIGHIEHCSKEIVVNSYELRDCLGNIATICERRDGTAYFYTSLNPNRREFCLNERAAYNRAYAFGYKYPV